MQNDTRFNEVLDLFLLDRSLSLSAGTLRHYREKLNAFSKFIGDAAIEDVSHIQCRAYLAGMKERGLSPHTIGGHYRDLRAFFNWCLAEKLLDTSPMARVTFKMKSWEPKQGVELSTVKQMLAVANRRDCVLILTLIDTGIRSRELTDVLCSDVDPFGDGTLVIRKGKNGRRRVLYMGKRLRRELARYIMEEGLSGDESLFKITNNGLRQMLRRVAKRAGIDAPKGISPHAFRRSCLLGLMRSNVPLPVIQQISGHQSLQVLQLYLAVDGSDVQKAIESSSVADNL